MEREKNAVRVKHDWGFSLHIFISQFVGINVKEQHHSKSVILFTWTAALDWVFAHFYSKRLALCRKSLATNGNIFQPKHTHLVKLETKHMVWIWYSMCDCGTKTNFFFSPHDTHLTDSNCIVINGTWQLTLFPRLINTKLIMVMLDT